MAAPVYVGDSGTDLWNTTSASATYVTDSFSVTTNNILVGLGGFSNLESWTLAISNSGTAHTWTERQKVSVANYCLAYGWTAPAAATQSNTATFTRGGSGSATLFGGIVLQFSGSDGVGASAKTNVASGAPSLSITTTQDNSAIVVFVLDWSAVDGASRTWRTVNSVTPTAANGLERSYFRDSAQYTVYSAYYSDAGTAGAKTVGLSAPGAQKYSIIAVEIKGTAAAATSPPPAQTGRIPAALMAMSLAGIMAGNSFAQKGELLLPERQLAVPSWYGPNNKIGV